MKLILFVYIIGQTFAARSFVHQEFQSGDGQDIVHTTSGKILGNVFLDEGYRTFLGIPYAKPPVDDLRFLPPIPATPWKDEILNTTTRQDNCAQPHYAWGPSWIGLNDTFSEDCLYLNVYAPLKPTGAKKDRKYPVMFFIYGGGYYYGGANDQQINGVDTVKFLRDVIIVVPNWRQGIFGNLGSSILRELSHDRSTGNAGFQDQQLAMKWMHENIERFSGDPSRVMLFGESAGAAAVSVHMTAKKSQGLFTRVGIESGAFVQWGWMPMHVAQKTFRWLVQLTDCKKDTPLGEVECLQDSKLWHTEKLSHLVDKNLDSMPFPDGWTNSTWAPAQDGIILPTDESPMDILRRGGAARVPVLLGANENEGVAFLSSTPIAQDYVSMSIGEHKYENWSLSNFGDKWGRKLMNIYNLRRHTPFFAAAAALGDDIIKCPTLEAARALTMKRPANSSADGCNWQCYLDRYPDLQSAFGDDNLEAAQRHWTYSGKASGRNCHCDSHEPVKAYARHLESEAKSEPAPAPKVFLYEFTHSPISYKLTDGGPCAAGAQGAFHGAELPYIFHVGEFLSTRYEHELSDYMAQYWRNFAYSGDPNIPPPWHEPTHNVTLPTWPEFRNHTEDYLELGTAPDGSVEARQVYNSDHCQFWADYRRVKMKV